MSKEDRNEFNPDYGDDPKVLHGVIKDLLEASGNTNAKIKELEAENDEHFKNIQALNSDRLATERENARLRKEKDWWIACMENVACVLRNTPKKDCSCNLIRDIATQALQQECGICGGSGMKITPPIGPCACSDKDGAE